VDPVQPFNPQLDYFGIGPVDAGAFPESPHRHPQATSAFNDLADQLPQFHTIPAYMASFVALASLSGVGSGWYTFQSIRVGTDCAEGSIVGADFAFKPADSAGSGGNAWGDAAGVRSAVVVQVNSGLPLSQFAAAPAFIPGIESTAPCVQSTPTSRGYVYKWKLPSGTFNAASPPEKTGSVRSAPFVWRVRRGDTIDFALVIPAAQVSLGAYACDIDVNLLFQPVRGAVAFTT
jgi:hypothetical protein